MDKITNLSYILYQSASSPAIKVMAIQLLNGEISLHELKKNRTILSEILFAETFLKKKKLDINRVQEFAEQFLLVEA